MEQIYCTIADNDTNGYFCSFNGNWISILKRVLLDVKNHASESFINFLSLLHHIRKNLDVFMTSGLSNPICFVQNWGKAKNLCDVSDHIVCFLLGH